MCRRWRIAQYDPCLHHFNRHFSICHANLARCIVGITSTNHAACVYRICADQIGEDFIIGGVIALAIVLVVALVVTIAIVAAQSNKADGTSEDIEGASNESLGEQN